MVNNFFFVLMISASNYERILIKINQNKLSMLIDLIENYSLYYLKLLKN